jgi:hypothetical protein
MSTRSSEQACAQPIDVLIPRPNVDRLGDVTAGEAVEHVAQLAQHERGHVLDAAHQHPRPLSTIDRNDALGDILRKIADALDLVGNPQDPDDLPKVIGYRLTPRNGLDRPFLDVVLHGIDVASAAIMPWRPASRLVSASIASASCLSAKPPISAIARASSCRSESKTLVVCAIALVDPSCATRREGLSYYDSMSVQ